MLKKSKEPNPLYKIAQKMEGEMQVASRMYGIQIRRCNSPESTDEDFNLLNNLRDNWKNISEKYYSILSKIKNKKKGDA